MASNAENVSIWWRHHASDTLKLITVGPHQGITWYPSTIFMQHFSQWIYVRLWGLRRRNTDSLIRKWASDFWFVKWWRIHCNIFIMDNVSVDDGPELIFNFDMLRTPVIITPISFSSWCKILRSNRNQKTMLNIPGSQLKSHWFGFNVGFKWACQTVELY